MGIVSTLQLIRNEVLVHNLECPASLAKYHARNKELLLKKKKSASVVKVYIR